MIELLIFPNANFIKRDYFQVYFSFYNQGNRAGATGAKGFQMEPPESHFLHYKNSQKSVENNKVLLET